MNFTFTDREAKGKHLAPKCIQKFRNKGKCPEFAMQLTDTGFIKPNKHWQEPDTHSVTPTPYPMQCGTTAALERHSSSGVCSMERTHGSKCSEVRAGEQHGTGDSLLSAMLHQQRTGQLLRGPTAYQTLDSQRYMMQSQEK